MAYRGLGLGLSINNKEKRKGESIYYRSGWGWGKNIIDLDEGILKHRSENMKLYYLNS